VTIKQQSHQEQLINVRLII